jgi:hypothetical protein
MRPQIARRPERSVALRARVVSALLVHQAHMRPQSARSPERSVALRARVVFALLVYRAYMRPQIARLLERSVALRARVSARLSKLFHPPGGCGEVQFCNFVESDARSTVLEMWNLHAKCSGRVDLRAALLHLQDAGAAIQLSFIAINNV